MLKKVLVLSLVLSASIAVIPTVSMAAAKQPAAQVAATFVDDTLGGAASDNNDGDDNSALSDSNDDNGNDDGSATDDDSGNDGSLDATE